MALHGLTKAYPGGRGITDVSFRVGPGEVFGYLGPNGAGKSTTIRHLMGFLRPDRGRAEINGMDCWRDAARVQAAVGYLPGEIGFPEDMTATQLLDLLARMRGLPAGRDRCRDLCDRFALDPRAAIRKLSKGNKQKVALVAAFRHTPDVLILDEPTSGLDPLMQRRFLELIGEERARGATVLMSSHSFDEVERVADRVGILKEGRLVAVEDVGRLRQVRRKVFTIATARDQDVTALEHVGFPVVARREREVELEVQGDYTAFVRALARFELRSLDVRPLDLEEIFMHYYAPEEAQAR